MDMEDMEDLDLILTLTLEALEILEVVEHFRKRFAKIKILGAYFCHTWEKRNGQNLQKLLVIWDSERLVSPQFSP